jgi:hypothetical protein
MHKAKQRWLVVGTIFFGLSLAGWMSAYLPAGNAQLPKSPIRAGDPLPANLFIELNKVINPTVVNISTSQTPTPDGKKNAGIPGSFF